MIVLSLLIAKYTLTDLINFGFASENFTKFELPSFYGALSHFSNHSITYDVFTKKKTNHKLYFSHFIARNIFRAQEKQ